MKALLACLLLSSIPSHAALSSLKERSSSSPPSTEEVLSPSDIFHFGGSSWTEIKKDYSKQQLYDAIYNTRKYLQMQREHWRPFINNQKDSQNFLEAFEKTLQEGSLQPIKQGAGSAYLINDAGGHPQFVLKPVDEDIHCLNNRKGLGSPFDYWRVRQGIPLYRSAQTDVLCYQVAQDLGLPAITPKTVMYILSHEQFYDLSSQIGEEEREQFLQLSGPADREKLCSIQEYLSESSSMRELIYSWLDKGVSDEQIQEWIDQEDFENINLFLWVTFDNDAHFGNFRAYTAYIKSETGGHPVYGLKKIDNGLSFPEINRDFSNDLLYFPNAKVPLSHRIKQKIFSIPVEKIIEEMRQLDMDSTVDAFVERMQVLQTLTARETITPYEINLRLKALEKPNGREIALNFSPVEELEKFLSLRTSDTGTSSEHSPIIRHHQTQENL